MENNIKTIAVVGADGRMGRLVCAKLEKEYNVIKIEKEDSLMGALKADLIIDFASGASSAKTAKFCAEYGIRLVVGATGQTKVEQQQIDNASKVVPVLQAGNFSVGIAKLKLALKNVLLDIAEDVVIFEKHHKSKVDSPSGTALEIAGVIEERISAKPQILVERGGKEIGTHQVDIYFGNEVLSVSHQAYSREVFADGAVLAIKFLLTKSGSGKYNFENALQR